jgi:hypothetical protein
MAQYIQRELVECLAENGVGITDAKDDAIWLPETERETKRQGSDPRKSE